MREIFIPKRRNNNGQRYGFARFKGVKDVHYLARQLDNIVIGGLKMFVNIPKYGRETQRKVALATKPQGREERYATNAGWARPPHHQKTQDSYAEVLTRNTRNPGQTPAHNNQPRGRETLFSSIYLDVGLEDTKWLNEAWVGRLKNPAMFERLEDDLLWETSLDIIPKYIGDDLVLLLGLNDARAEQLMSGEEDGGTSMFYSMEKWSPGICPGCRLTWVQCWVSHSKPGMQNI